MIHLFKEARNKKSMSFIKNEVCNNKFCANIGTQAIYLYSKADKKIKLIINQQNL